MKEKDKKQNKDRREFLKVAAAGAGAAAIVALGAEQASADTVPQLQRPLTAPRILSSQSRQVGNFKETQAAMETVGSNGVRMVNDALIRETEDDTTITKTMTMRTMIFAADSNTPAKTTVQTIMSDITKGQVVGDRRHDRGMVTIIDSTGIHTLPPITVKKPLQDPYANLTDQEKAQRIFADKGLL